MSPFVWLAASAGGAALLTPCVFPMVPITVSYFARYAGDRGATLRQALLFALGIIAAFTGLGLAFALLVGAAGLARFAASPSVNVALAVLFVAFALNLFGVWAVRLPWRTVAALERAVSRETRAGRDMVATLLMGLAFTVTSFTCTAPFVGTLLVAAAAGRWERPLVGMLVFSSVFALPFFVLALVPRWVARLPRGGEWLEVTKLVMGFAELAAAVKFLSNVDLVLGWGVLTREVVLASWVLLAALAAATVAGSSRPRPGVGRLAGTAAIGVLALWLAAGVGGRSMGELESFLPATGAPGPTVTRASSGGSSPAELTWVLNDHVAALARARSEGRSVFIDFTGYTCTNCRWMEANIFSRSEVKRELAGYILSRLFTDGEGSLYENQQAFQQRQFGTVALPLYAVVDADGATRATFAGLTRDPAVFVAFLRAARERPVAAP